ncbi:MAG TPA: hypothetical protein VEU96_30830 [Bryobacteraceae bacterium]|nr:hypothetical protein [Bryobacteraceae bacterium]
MRLNLVSLLTAGLALMSVGGFAQQTPGIAAHWEGTMQMPEKEMGIVVDLGRNPKGEWIGSFSIPSGEIIDAPLMDISVKGATVRFGLGVAKAFLEGTLSGDGNGLTGTATSERGTAPFQLKRSGEARVKTPAPSTSLSKDFEGTWEGTLEAPGGPLHAILKLARASDGAATGTLISVDEGGQEFAITTIKQEDKQLEFEIRVIRSKYSGSLNGNGEIAGEYALPQLNLPLVFKRQAGKQ